MATQEKNISVDGSFKLRIGETEVILSKEEAQRLYGKLYQALGKSSVTYTNVPAVGYTVGGYTTSLRDSIKNLAFCGDL